jgi:hypothetical protein
VRRASGHLPLFYKLRHALEQDRDDCLVQIGANRELKAAQCCYKVCRQRDANGLGRQPRKKEYKYSLTAPKSTFADPLRAAAGGAAPWPLAAVTLPSI